MSETFLGIDIGGTKIRAALFDGKTVNYFKETKTPKTKKLFFDAVFEVINFLNKKSEKIGVAFAGLINENGNILQSPNLNFLEGANLVNFIRNEFNAEVLIDNDVNCFLRAEKKFGAVKNYSNVVAITVGSGLGAAIMIDNKIIRGANYSAGEIGHSVFPKIIVLNEEKKRYTLKWDEFEGFVSQKWFQEFKFEGSKKESVKEIADMVKKGDNFAQHIFNEFGVNLAFVVSMLINTLDPETVLIGGGIAKSKNLFYSSFRKYVKKFIFSEVAKENIKIIFSNNDNSAAIGAALLFENYYER